MEKESCSFNCCVRYPGKICERTLADIKLEKCHFLGDARGVAFFTRPRTRRVTR